MQAYMKSAMPYHGVPAPVLRKTCKALFASVDLPNEKVWRSHVLELWRGAKYREERYGSPRTKEDLHGGAPTQEGGGDYALAIVPLYRRGDVPLR